MPQLNANALGSLPISLWMMQLWKRWVEDEILCSQVTRIFNMLGSQQSRPRADHHLFIAPNGTIQPLHPLSRNRGHWTRPMPSIRQNAAFVQCSCECHVSHPTALYAMPDAILSDAHRTNVHVLSDAVQRGFREHFWPSDKSEALHWTNNIEVYVCRWVYIWVHMKRK
jgi:hypothetical protein